MPLHRKASLYLILTAAIWGLSFPLTRALTIAQQIDLPHTSSWFLTSVTVAFRFGLAGILLLLFTCRSGFRPTRSEWIQGVGLGLFASGGLLLQNDGLFRTTASVSAFLTQIYCAIIPIYTAFRLRKFPGKIELAAIFLVISGVAILSGLRWNELRLGRGEMETLISAVFFGGQILWLERSAFQKNRATVFSIVMFFTVSLLMLAFAGSTVESWSDFGNAFHTWPSQAIGLFLALFCTLFTFGMMNRWQPHVTAVEAGLIYCLEPVFAAGLALFVPGWLKNWTGLPLLNELFTGALVLGGSAILLANLVVLLTPKSRVLNGETDVFAAPEPFREKTPGELAR